MQEQRTQEQILLLLCSITLLGTARCASSLTATSSGSQGAAEASIVHIDALMPEHHTEHEEAYLCTSVLLPDDPLKLIGVEPLSKQEVVHHMLLFGVFPQVVSAWCLSQLVFLPFCPDREDPEDSAIRCRMCKASIHGGRLGLPHAQCVRRGGQPCAVRLGKEC